MRPASADVHRPITGGRILIFSGGLPSQLSLDVRYMGLDGIERLTESQRSYLRLVFEHKSSKEIAQQLGISAHTVDKRIKEAMRILGVNSRIEAARILAGVKESGTDQALGPQSPDLAITPASPFVAARSVGGNDGGDSDVNNGAGAQGISPRPPRASGASRRFPLPFPTADRPENDLSFLQRVGWTLGLIIGLAVATGILLSGLTAVGMLVMALNR